MRVNEKQKRIIKMLSEKPCSPVELARALYPVGRGCGRLKKQRVYATISVLRRKGFQIFLSEGKYYIFSRSVTQDTGLN